MRVKKRIFSVVYISAVKKSVVLTVRGDELAEACCSAHRGAHHVRILHAAAVVGKAGGEGRHGLQIRKRLSPLAPGDGPVGDDAHPRVPPDELQLPLKRRQITFEVNVHATLDLAQAVLPGMRAKKRGWIINLSSASSQHPKGPPFGGGESTTITVYGASKAALERITTGLAAEVYGDGIAVNSIAPVAAVRTPGAEALVGELMKTNPDLVEPVEWLAEAVLALATCDPRTCTGRILYSGPFLDEIGRKPSVG